MGVGQQILRAVHLHETALVHDHHAIRGHDGAEAVRDREHRASVEVLVDGFLDDGFCMNCVSGGGCEKCCVGVGVRSVA